jgi:hypothetical protein
MLAPTIAKITGAVYVILISVILIANIVQFNRNKFPEYLPGNLENLEMLANQLTFKGNWAINKPFKQLKHNYGKLRGFFYQHIDKSASPPNVYKVLRLIMFDSKYSESHYIEIDLIYSVDFLMTSQVLNRGEEKLPRGGSVRQFADGEKTESWKLGLKGSFEFNQDITVSARAGERMISTSAFYSNQSLIKGIFEFAGDSSGAARLWEGPSPKINFKLAYDFLDNTTHSIVFYSFMLSVLMLSIYGSVNILIKAKADPSYLTSLSVLSFSVACLWDMSFLFINLLLSVWYFEFCSFLILIPLSVFVTITLNCMIFFQLISLHIPRTLNQALPSLYLRVLICALWVVAQFLVMRYLGWLIFKQWFLILHSLILVPQIIKNFSRNSPVTIEREFIVYFCIVKFGYFIYLRWFSSNIIGREPTHGLLMIAMSLAYTSWVVLNWQSVYGARNIVPKVVDVFIKYHQRNQANPEQGHQGADAANQQADPIPVIIPAPRNSNERVVDQWQDADRTEFNAEQSINIMSDHSSSQVLCKICLANIDKSEEPMTTQSNSSGRRRGRKTTVKFSSKTLCGHEFHTECLKLWTQNCKECPQCRTVIEYLPA